MTQSVKTTKYAQADRKEQLRAALRPALSDFAALPLAQAARNFWNVLDYRSDRVAELHRLADVPDDNGLLDVSDLNGQATGFEFLFQLTEAEVKAVGQPGLAFGAGRYEQSIVESYLFVAVQLKGEHYKRSDLAKYARALNRVFGQPVLSLFRYGSPEQPQVSLAVILRRLNKRDETRDVLEQVTLVYGVDARNPTRGHLDILADLSLPSLLGGRVISHFKELEDAWARAFDVEQLNERFFKELSNWFYWATKHEGVSFPDERGLSADELGPRRQQSLIRLITRLMFVWFLREKGLVPPELFERKHLAGLLRDFEPEDAGSSQYYQAILQNLFFATLNTPMQSDDPKQQRQFISEKTRNNQGYGVHTLYRYPEYFRSEQAAIDTFADVPFLNGGLFECLDDKLKKPEVLIDGFSTNTKKRATLPNELFFAGERQPDLNEIYQTKGKKYPVRGIIELLDSYKFTVSENTPIEQEVALDPELLGKVFENLLAAYVPETKDTARKQTGSFYTPRDVVDDMVDGALTTYLADALKSGPDDRERLQDLLSYQDTPHKFAENEIQALVAAIDRLDILDPACGSGAFPMGVLHKLVHVLGKLDPKNERLYELQRERAFEKSGVSEEYKQLLRDLRTAEQIQTIQVRDDATRNLKALLEQMTAAIDPQITDLDYFRKLILIENCIYGIDVQPIAAQISKLRCFISLIIDQKGNNDPAKNRGIIPLPNLETQFVAANTLFKLSEQEGLGGRSERVEALRDQLAEVRHQHFSARTRATKKKLRDEDKRIRDEIRAELTASGMPGADANRIAAFDLYNQNVHADFFDPKWMFSLKGSSPGFHIVIGNPPYVRQEKIKDDKPALKTAYAKVFDGKADLFVYFFARGVELLNPGGVLSYICSNKYFRSGYGKGLRELLGRQRILRAIDFGDAPVFDAIAFPSILEVQKAKPEEGHTVQALNWGERTKAELSNFRTIAADESFRLPQSTLKSDGWRIEGSDVTALLDRLKAVGTPLGEYVNGRFYRGILTGLNEAFVVNRETRDQLIAEHSSSEEVLKPYLRGRDVKRWRAESADLWLIFTRRPFPIDKYPAIKRHLEQFKPQLMPGVPGGRKPGSYEWYEIQDNIAYYKEFEKYKIEIPAITDKANYSLDTSGHYSNDKTSIIAIESYAFLLGLLNSSVLWWYTCQISPTRVGGFFELKPIYISKLPIASSKLQTEHLITQIVDGILTLMDGPRSPRSALAVAYFEQLLDALVYELYLPEDLHEAGRFPLDVIGAAGWPDGTGGAVPDEAALLAHFDTIYDPQHPVRTLLYYLDSLPVVRLIEGKTGA